MLKTNHNITFATALQQKHFFPSCSKANSLITSEPAENQLAILVHFRRVMKQRAIPHDI